MCLTSAEEALSYQAPAQTPRKAADFAITCTPDQGMLLDVALDHLVLEVRPPKAQTLPMRI